MCDQTEIEYKAGEVVWCKLSNIWWPAQVQDQTSLDEEVTQGLKKKPIAVVKFFNEDYYEFVKDIKQIYNYNSSKKWEFIKKGMDQYRTRGDTNQMSKFPKDIIMAEELTGGNVNILDDPRVAPEEKVSYKEFFTTPKSQKEIKNLKKLKSFPFKTKVVSVFNSGKSDSMKQYFTKYLVQNIKENDSLVQHYKCPDCSFACSRVTALACHRSFNKGLGCPKAPIKFGKFNSIPIKSEKNVTKRKSMGHETGPAKKKVKTPAKGQAVEETAKKTVKPPVVKEVKEKDKKKFEAMREQLLMDWNEEDAEEAATDASRDSSAQVVDGKDKEKPVVDNANKTSCFDFEDNDEDVNIDRSVRFGQKLPRVIPKEDKSKEKAKDKAQDDALEEEFNNLMKETSVPVVPIMTDSFLSDSSALPGSSGKAEANLGTKANDVSGTVDVKSQETLVSADPLKTLEKSEEEEPVGKTKSEDDNSSLLNALENDISPETENPEDFQKRLKRSNALCSDVVKKIKSDADLLASLRSDSDSNSGPLENMALRKRHKVSASKTSGTSPDNSSTQRSGKRKDSVEKQEPLISVRDKSPQKNLSSKSRLGSGKKLLLDEKSTSHPEVKNSKNLKSGLNLGNSDKNFPSVQHSTKSPNKENSNAFAKLTKTDRRLSKSPISTKTMSSKSLVNSSPLKGVEKKSPQKNIDKKTTSFSCSRSRKKEKLNRERRHSFKKSLSSTLTDMNNFNIDEGSNSMEESVEKKIAMLLSDSSSCDSLNSSDLIGSNTPRSKTKDGGTPSAVKRIGDRSKLKKPLEKDGSFNKSKLKDVKKSLPKKSGTISSSASNLEKCRSSESNEKLIIKKKESSSKTFTLVGERKEQRDSSRKDSLSTRHVPDSKDRHKTLERENKDIKLKQSPSKSSKREPGDKIEKEVNVALPEKKNNFKTSKTPVKNSADSKGANNLGNTTKDKSDSYKIQSSSARNVTHDKSVGKNSEKKTEVEASKDSPKPSTSVSTDKKSPQTNKTVEGKKKKKKLYYDDPYSDLFKPDIITVSKPSPKASDQASSSPKLKHKDEHISSPKLTSPSSSKEKISKENSSAKDFQKLDHSRSPNSESKQVPKETGSNVKSPVENQQLKSLSESKSLQKNESSQKPEKKSETKSDKMGDSSRGVKLLDIVDGKNKTDDQVTMCQVSDVPKAADEVRRVPPQVGGDNGKDSSAVPLETETLFKLEENSNSEFKLLEVLTGEDTSVESGVKGNSSFDGILIPGMASPHASKEGNKTDEDIRLSDPASSSENSLSANDLKQKPKSDMENKSEDAHPISMEEEPSEDLQNNALSTESMKILKSPVKKISEENVSGSTESVYSPEPRDTVNAEQVVRFKSAPSAGTVEDKLASCFEETCNEISLSDPSASVTFSVADGGDALTKSCGVEQVSLLSNSSNLFEPNMQQSSGEDSLLKDSGASISENTMEKAPSKQTEPGQGTQDITARVEAYSETKILQEASGENTSLQEVLDYYTSSKETFTDEFNNRVPCGDDSSDAPSKQESTSEISLKEEIPSYGVSSKERSSILTECSKSDAIPSFPLAKDSITEEMEEMFSTVGMEVGEISQATDMEGFSKQNIAVNKNSPAMSNTHCESGVVLPQGDSLLSSPEAVSFVKAKNHSPDINLCKNVPESDVLTAQICEDGASVKVEIPSEDDIKCEKTISGHSSLPAQPNNETSIEQNAVESSNYFKIEGSCSDLDRQGLNSTSSNDDGETQRTSEKANYELSFDFNQDSKLDFVSEVVISCDSSDRKDDSVSEQHKDEVRWKAPSHSDQKSLVGSDNVLDTRSENRCGELGQSDNAMYGFEDEMTMSADPSSEVVITTESEDKTTDSVEEESCIYNFDDQMTDAATIPLCLPVSKPKPGPFGDLKINLSKSSKIVDSRDFPAKVMSADFLTPDKIREIFQGGGGGGCSQNDGSLITPIIVPPQSLLEYKLNPTQTSVKSGSIDRNLKTQDVQSMEFDINSMPIVIADAPEMMPTSVGSSSATVTSSVAALPGTTQESSATQVQTLVTSSNAKKKMNYLYIKFVKPGSVKPKPDSKLTVYKIPSACKSITIPNFLKQTSGKVIKYIPNKKQVLKLSPESLTGKEFVIVSSCGKKKVFFSPDSSILSSKGRLVIDQNSSIRFQNSEASTSGNKLRGVSTPSRTVQIVSSNSLPLSGAKTVAVTPQLKLVTQSHVVSYSGNKKSVLNLQQGSVAPLDKSRKLVKEPGIIRKRGPNIISGKSPIVKPAPKVEIVKEIVSAKPLTDNTVSEGAALIVTAANNPDCLESGAPVRIAPKEDILAKALADTEVFQDSDLTEENVTACVEEYKTVQIPSSVVGNDVLPASSVQSNLIMGSVLSSPHGIQPSMPLLSDEGTPGRGFFIKKAPGQPVFRFECNPSVQRVESKTDIQTDILKPSTTLMADINLAEIELPPGCPPEVAPCSASLQDISSIPLPPEPYTGPPSLPSSDPAFKSSHDNFTSSSNSTNLTSLFQNISNS